MEIDFLGKNELVTRHFLEPVLEHRTVLLMKDVDPDVDPSLGIDADDVRVIRRVVDLAEAEAVGDDGLTTGMPIVREGQASSSSMCPSRQMQHFFR